MLLKRFDLFARLMECCHLEWPIDSFGIERAALIERKARTFYLDLHNKHLNRIFKDDLNTFRANITDKSVERSSRSIGKTEELLVSIDKQLKVHTPSKWMPCYTRY